MLRRYPFLGRNVTEHGALLSVFSSHRFMTLRRTILFYPVTLHRPTFFIILLVLLCYKRSAPQNGQPGSWLRMWRAMAIRSVAMDAGLCRA